MRKAINCYPVDCSSPCPILDVETNHACRQAAALPLFESCGSRESMSVSKSEAPTGRRRLYDPVVQAAQSGLAGGAAMSVNVVLLMCVDFVLHNFSWETFRIYKAVARARNVTAGTSRNGGIVCFVSASDDIASLFFLLSPFSSRRCPHAFQVVAHHAVCAVLQGVNIPRGDAAQCVAPPFAARETLTAVARRSLQVYNDGGRGWPGLRRFYAGMPFALLSACAHTRTCGFVRGVEFTCDKNSQWPPSLALGTPLQTPPSSLDSLSCSRPPPCSCGRSWQPRRRCAPIRCATGRTCDF